MGGTDLMMPSVSAVAMWQAFGENLQSVMGAE